MLNFGVRVGGKADLIMALEAKKLNREPAFAKLKHL